MHNFVYYSYYKEQNPKAVSSKISCFLMRRGAVGGIYKESIVGSNDKQVAIK